MFNLAFSAYSAYSEHQKEKRLYGFLAANFKMLAKLITASTAEIINQIKSVKDSEIKSKIAAVKSQADLYFSKPRVEEREFKYWVRSKEYPAEAANLQAAIGSAMTDLITFYGNAATDVYTAKDLKYVYQAYLSLASLQVMLQLDIARGEYYYYLNDYYSAKNNEKSKTDAKQAYYTFIKGPFKTALENILNNLKTLDDDWDGYHNLILSGHTQTFYKHYDPYKARYDYGYFRITYKMDEKLHTTWLNNCTNVNFCEKSIWNYCDCSRVDDRRVYRYDPSDPSANQSYSYLRGYVLESVLPSYHYHYTTPYYNSDYYTNPAFIWPNEKRLIYHYFLTDTYKPTQKLIHEYWLRLYQDAGGSADDFGDSLVPPQYIETIRTEVANNPPLFPDYCEKVDGDAYVLDETGRKCVKQNSSSISIFSLNAAEVNLTQEPGVIATQSSTAWEGTPGRAIDGNIDGDYWKHSVTHTNNARDSYWQGTLAGTYKINRILIHNRSDCCGSRLSNFRVSALDEDGNEVWGENYFVGSGGVPQGGVHSVALPDNTFARSVRVQFLGFNNDGNGYLSLAEVRIMGDPNRSLINLAQEPGVVATQSSTGWEGTPGRAIDGNTDGDYWKHSVTHTENGANSYWQADLGAAYKINRILTHNRSDCCGSRLSNFRVSALDEDGNEVWGENYFVGSGGVPQGGVHSAALPDNTFARSVRVQFLGFNNDGNGYLSLAEVRIMGEK